MGKERRRRTRHSATHWEGRYRFGGAPGWRSCELVDVSATGAGFQAFMLATDALPMADVELELTDRGDPEPEPLRLRGRVAHLTRSNAGHVRVGMEFVDLTELEGRLVAMLFRRDAGRHSRSRALPQIPDPDRASDLPVH